MNLPSLPTDNLYKFLALSGLALLIFSYIFPKNFLDDMELKTIETQTQIKLLAPEVSILGLDLKFADPKSKLLEKNSEILSDRQQEVNVKSIQLEGQKLRHTTLLQQFRFTLYLSFFGIILGFIIADIGFWLWYVRVQKPTDLLLRKQAETLSSPSQIS